MNPNYTLDDAERDSRELDPVAAFSILVGLRYLCVQLEGQLPPDVYSFLDAVDVLGGAWTEGYLARG